jgi:hypothetical protein
MVDMQKPLRRSNFSKFVDFSSIKGGWKLVKLILGNYTDLGRLNCFLGINFANINTNKLFFNYCTSVCLNM